MAYTDEIYMDLKDLSGFVGFTWIHWNNINFISCGYTHKNRFPIYLDLRGFPWIYLIFSIYLDIRDLRSDLRVFAKLPWIYWNSMDLLEFT